MVLATIFTWALIQNNIGFVIYNFYYNLYFYYSVTNFANCCKETAVCNKCICLCYVSALDTSPL